uniref:Glycoprotein-N-acetylgalactosamine 3-beta-galactosyltransferase 1 n=1 Tax=Clastoptera arizonana TaxID=38151 RepID=A0A1B6DQC5_9HEMI
MIGKTFISSFAMGMVFGFMFAYILLYLSSYQVGELFQVRKIVSQKQKGDPHHHHDVRNEEVIIGDVGGHDHDEEFHKDEDLVAQEMAKQVRILCWVMTSPKDHEKKAKHVKATWGKRCNILIFISSKNDSSLPAVGLNIAEGRDTLWGKTKGAFKHVYSHYLDSVDWVMKADDDTYVIVENLRYLLSKYNTSDPLYFGCRFKPYVKQGYMSGGAGYVLSKEAVKRFVEKALPDTSKCRQDDGGSEDLEMGKCLENVEVRAMDSRDSLGRGRFFPFIPQHHLSPGHTDPDFWYWHYIYYPTVEGMECCSDTAITFHYLSPSEMYVMEYLIYHLRPYGITHHVPKEENSTLKIPIQNTR